MVEWRRNKVQELLVQGHSQWDIANNLKVDQSTISRDIDYLRQQSKQKVRKYIDETLPNEYEKCLVGITSILREAWNTSQSTDTSKREHSANKNKNRSIEKNESSSQESKEEQQLIYIY